MTTSSTPSILRSLRQPTPRRACSFTEALNLAECQAAKLNQLLASRHPGYQLTGITEDHLTQLPRVRIDQTGIARALDPELLPARCARPIHTPDGSRNASPSNNRTTGGDRA